MSVLHRLLRRLLAWSATPRPEVREERPAYGGSSVSEPRRERHDWKSVDFGFEGETDFDANLVVQSRPPSRIRFPE